MKTIRLVTFIILSALSARAQDSTSTKKMADKKHKLDVVEIKQKTNGNSLNNLSPYKIERLGAKELAKNACCTLAESFESNASVEIGSTNALSGAKQVEMLGLQGTYVQTMLELLPQVRGINYTYGFNNIPGPFVESIFINKGPGSVTNSFESMTGQIDVELIKPERYKPQLFINGYYNNFSRRELNINSATKLTDELSTLLSVHGSQQTRKMDFNGDGFLDMPMNKMLHIMNRWKFEKGRFETMLAGTYHKSNQQSGQLNFNHSKQLTEQNNLYGIEIMSDRLDLMHKMGYGLTKDRTKSIGLQTALSSQNINSYYGRTMYDAFQQSLYSNLIFQTNLINTNHQLRFGGGIQADKVLERFQGISQNRDEAVTGAFSEYTYVGSEKVTVLVGARGDYNWRLKKAYFIPRLNVKYDFNNDFSARFSGGSGFRTATVLAENTRFFASSRQLKITEPLLPEYSWNYGLNLNYNLNQNGKDGRISLDVFRTDFTNQVVVDYDVSPQEVYLYNLNGISYAWYIQAEWYYELFKNFDIRLAYKFNDVKTTQNGVLRERVFNPKNRALFNLAYETNNEKWAFDFTTQWVGKQRLPDYSINPVQFRPESGVSAPDYFRLLGQVSYRMKNIELYAGSENIGNYRQQDLVLSSDNPYSSYFDAGAAWGPTTGRMVYAGFRYTLQHDIEPVLTVNKIITERIKVSGNCGMCKETIEGALKVEGIKFAEWDDYEKILTVRYNKTKITNDAIQQRVAAVGYDTEKYRAEDAVYDKLPDCCLYR